MAVDMRSIRLQNKGIALSWIQMHGVAGTVDIVVATIEGMSEALVDMEGREKAVEHLLAAADRLMVKTEMLNGTIEFGRKVK